MANDPIITPGGASSAPAPAQGMLHVTTAQRDALVSPVPGMQVFNTTTNRLNIFTTVWEEATTTPTYNPANVAGLRAWFKADALSGIDGQPVASWTDLTGNGWNLDQTPTTPATLPIFKTGIVNGRSVLRFNGTTQSLGSFTLPMIVHPLTIFMVVQSRSIAHGGSFMDTNGGHRIGLQFVMDAGNVIHQDINFNYLNPIPWAADGFHVVVQRINGANTYLHKDAVSAGPSVLPVADWSDGFWIGSEYYASAPSPIDIAEVLIYSAELADADRLAVMAYLGARYGITVI